MKRHLIRRLTILFFVVYLLAVIWPVATWFSGPAPLVLGLPLPLAWSIAWILGGFIVLIVLNWVEERDQDG
jgi:amino acid transporter